MYAQFFGNYLLSCNVITKEQLIHAMQKKASSHLKLGTLAIHAGYMTASEVDRILIMQTHQDKFFGELAISEGYLTEAQLKELLASQKPDFLLLSQAFVDDGILDNQQLQDLFIAYQSENELNDLDYSTEIKDGIDQMMERFLALTDTTFSSYELSYIRLLFNNLIRFIGDDFTMVTPYVINEYPTNYCASQVINGDFSLHTYIDMPEYTCIEFASRYAKENFTEFDEYVQASIEDFINLHNGMFNVNISNTFSVELALEPPEVHVEELISFNKNVYILPIIYPFGTLHFLLEVIDS